MHDILVVLIFKDFIFSLKYCTLFLKLSCWGGEQTADHSVVLQIIRREMQRLKVLSLAKGHLLADRNTDRATVSDEICYTIKYCLYWDLEIKDFLLK